MTLPIERARAVLNVEEQARTLSVEYMKGNQFVRIPTERWFDFMRCFRHYPTRSELERTAEACPELWRVDHDV